jgi:antitoxin ParD1/3/4
MSSVLKVSVALTPEMIGMMKEAVDAGEYTSTSEVVRDALRVWKARRAAHDAGIEELRGLWRDGLESGAPLDGEALFESLHTKYRRLADNK